MTLLERPSVYLINAFAKIEDFITEIMSLVSWEGSEQGSLVFISLLL